MGLPRISWTSGGAFSNAARKQTPRED